MKISICIPTYNRHCELAYFVVERLIPLVSEALKASQLEIVICDNSDPDVAALNRATLGGLVGVTYIDNVENIGFARNVLKVVQMAKGEFVWIMPDNDDVISESFSELVSFILTDRSEFDCMVVPYSYGDVLGEVRVGAKLLDFDGTLAGCFSRGNVPFILLSSVIFRKQLKSSSLDVVCDRFSNNSFVQIPLILSCLDHESVIRQWDQPVVDYNVEYNGRFSPFNCYESIVDVLHYVKDEYGIQVGGRIRAEYRSMLMSIISASSGIYNVCGVDQARLQAYRLFPRNFGLKALLLLLIVSMPRSFKATFYVNYISMRAAIAKFQGYRNRLAGEGASGND